MICKSIVLISLLVLLSHSAEVPYATFQGTIPGLIYPINLTANDNLVATLSWDPTVYINTELDLILYADGMDILNFDIYTTVVYTDNSPEILQYKVNASGLYYLRVDLVYGYPTDFKLVITVNGNDVRTIYGTAVTLN